jgi:Cellulase M and related proteins
MHSFTLSLDIDMLLAQLRVLGNIGLDANPEGGRTRIALTEQDKAGRDQLVKWMLELDMDVKVDRIGNIFGILPAAKESVDHRPVMIGSHIDTVRNAGAGRMLRRTGRAGRRTGLSHGEQASRALDCCGCFHQRRRCPLPTRHDGFTRLRGRPSD